MNELSSVKWCMAGVIRDCFHQICFILDLISDLCSIALSCHYKNKSYVKKVVVLFDRLNHQQREIHLGSQEMC